MSLADSLEERFDPESDSDSDSDLDLEIDKYKGKVSAKSDVSKEDVEAKKDEIVKRNESVSPVVEDNSSTVKTNDMFTHPIVKHTSIGDIFWAYGYMDSDTIRWPCFVIRNRSVLSQTDYNFMKNYKEDGTHLILFADPYKSFFKMLPENNDFLDHPFDPNSAEHDLLVNQFKNYSKTPSKSKRRKSSKSKPPLTKKLRTLERSFKGALEFATKVFELAQERAQREDEMLSRFKEKEKKEFDEAINEHKVAASKLVEEVTKIISSSAVLQDETIMSISPGDTIRILHMSNVYVSNVTKIETIDKAALRIHFSTLVTGIGPYYTVKNSSPQKQKRASSRRSSQDEGLTRDLIVQKVLPIEMILKIGEQDPSDPRSPIAAKGDCALAVESGDPNSLKTASNSELVNQMTSISESDVRNDAVGGAGVDVSNTVEKPSGEKVVQVATPMDTADGDVPDSIPYSENADIVPKDQASISANENPDVNEVGGAGTQETMVVNTSEPENPESLQCTAKGQDSQLSLATSNAMNAAIKPIHKEKAGEVRKEPNSDQSSLNEEKAMEVKEDTSSNQAEGDQTHSDERPEEAKGDISSDDADNTKPFLEDTIQETQGENNGDQADKGKPFLEETIQNAKEETSSDQAGDVKPFLEETVQETSSDQAGDVKPLLDETAKETKEKVSNEISCDGLNPNAELKPVEVTSEDQTTDASKDACLSKPRLDEIVDITQDGIPSARGGAPGHPLETIPKQKPLVNTLLVLEHETSNDCKSDAIANAEFVSQSNEVQSDEVKDSGNSNQTEEAEVAKPTEVSESNVVKDVASSEAPSVSAPLTPKKKRFIYVTLLLSIKIFKLVQELTRADGTLEFNRRTQIKSTLRSPHICLLL